MGKLVKIVCERLDRIGCEKVTASVLNTLLEAAYHSTMTTEEGRFIKVSTTYINPRIRPEDGPATRRADYPSVWPLAKKIPLTVGRLVKIARAIDMWSGSIAVYCYKTNQICIWGMIDQLVQSNISLHQEANQGFSNPGVFTITTEGAGNLSVFHQTVFLGGIRGHKILLREHDTLRSRMVFDRIMPHIILPAKAITHVTSPEESYVAQFSSLFESWVCTISRLCIGLRRHGTGGSLLLTSQPNYKNLEINYKFKYNRLSQAMILNVLDETYSRSIDPLRDDDCSLSSVAYDSVLEHTFAETDAQDRSSELAGSVKVVTSLASIDGLVLLSPMPDVLGFGVKICSSTKICTVYDGAGFTKKGIQANRVDTSCFGTRHNSMLRYCKSDKSAIGIIVSQDGHVRIAMSMGRSLVLWDNVKLLNYNNFTQAQVSILQNHARDRQRSAKPILGYTCTPKTLSALFKVLDAS